MSDPTQADIEAVLELALAIEALSKRLDDFRATFLYGRKPEGAHS